MVTFENYEEYMMLYADGELSGAAINELLDFVAEHPELESELNAYMSTRLEPEMELVFANKESLLHPEPAKKTIAFGWIRYGVAAGVALLLGVGIYNLNRSDKTLNNNVAVTKPQATKTQPIAAKVVVNQTDTINSRPATLAPAKNTIRKKQNAHTTIEEASRNQKAQERSNLAMLQSAPEQGFAVNMKPYVSDIYATADPIIINSKEPVRKSHMPVSDENKETMYALGQAISDKVHDVKNLTANIKTSGVGFNIGGKEIKVNF
ncbi:anti-sigma factor [Taibaiella soli]|uniref:Uncharacterized protein n=1 Tax=Taibaiella soli TaxID=1649169 RepID=A0A2W2A9Y2_9BACT|nr:hypothetical protein [Taibaiella soli]PZF72205.1 hypothetical protein DN068_14840 [Taibaiella soli]